MNYEVDQFYGTMSGFLKVFSEEIVLNRTDSNYLDELHHNTIGRHFLSYKDILTNQNHFFSYYNLLN